MVEEVILLLIIGHLIGDFLLQTEKLVIWKQKELRGAAFHGLIIALTMQLVLLPFYPQFYLLAAVQGLLHILIDWAKNKLVFPVSGGEIIAFVIDQFLHLLVILGGVYFLAALGKPSESLLPIDRKILLIVIIYLLNTVFAAIFLQMLVNFFFPPSSTRPFISWQSKAAGLLERVMLTTAILSGAHFLLLVGLLVTPLAYLLQQFKEVKERIWLRFMLSICWVFLLTLAFNSQYL